jgi:hypothetical protein
VRALVVDDAAPVAMIFVDAHLERALLEHARAIGEPEALVERAAAALRPAGAPHNDHFHVRLAGGDERLRVASVGQPVKARKAGKHGKAAKLAKAKAKGKGGRKVVAAHGSREARAAAVAKKPAGGKVRPRGRGK